MLLGISPLRLSTAKRNRKPWGVGGGGQRRGEVGKVEGRQKDRGKGPGSSRLVSQLKTSTLPPLCSLPLPCPVPWDPRPHPLPTSDLSSFPLDSSLRSLAPPLSLQASVPVPLPPGSLLPSST